MSKSVEIDASKGVECVENIDMSDSSEVYLALFWRRATRDMISFQEFKNLAETWLRILHLERLAEEIGTPGTASPTEDDGLDYKSMYNKLVDSLLESDEVQIDQHTFVSKSDAEAEIEAMRAEPEKKQKNAAKSAAGKSSFARRKQAALEAVKSARASGCTLQGIADQSNLSLTMVMDLINGVARPVTDWTKLEKGLKKLGHPPRPIPKEEDHEQED